MTNTPALTADGLTKTYDELVALHPLELVIPSGQSVAPSSSSSA